MNIRKIIAGVVACCVVCGGLPVLHGGFSESAVVTNAYEEYGDFMYKVINDGTIEIRRCSEEVVSVEIPPEIDGKAVTRIGAEAFYKCTNLESIIIPDSVTDIYMKAFYGCTSLESITIPESANIGYAAFSGTEWLEKRQAENPLIIAGNILIGRSRKCEEDVVVIPDGVTVMGDYAFGGNKSLKSVIIPGSVTSISQRAFNNCENLESIIISDGVTSIGDHAFAYCTSLKSIIIPESVTSIGDHAFAGCTSLKSIIISESVTSIGDWTFKNCTSLESITIPESVTSIGYDAFSDTEWLENRRAENPLVIVNNILIDAKTYKDNVVVIPDDVTSIGEYAFSGCMNLKSVTIPNGVRNMGQGAFFYCVSLESVEIPESVTSIGYHVFYDCKNLIDVYYSGTEEDWEKITIFEDNDDLKNSTIHYNYKPESDRTEVLLGDANGDGALTIADATAIVQFIANPDRYPLDEKALKNADCYNPGDGVTPLDAYAIQLLEAGTIKSLPYIK